MEDVGIYFRIDARMGMGMGGGIDIIIDVRIVQAPACGRDKEF